MGDQLPYPIAHRLPPEALRAAVEREYRTVPRQGDNPDVWRTDATHLYGRHAPEVLVVAIDPEGCCPLGVACLAALGDRLGEFLDSEFLDSDFVGEHPLSGSVGLPDAWDVARVLEFLGAGDYCAAEVDAAQFIADFDAGRIEPAEPLRAALGVGD
jgi:hypothetical protein